MTETTRDPCPGPGWEPNPDGTHRYTGCSQRFGPPEIGGWTQAAVAEAYDGPGAGWVGDALAVLHSAVELCRAAGAGWGAIFRVLDSFPSRRDSASAEWNAVEPDGAAVPGLLGSALINLMLAAERRGPSIDLKRQVDLIMAARQRAKEQTS